jgi:mersacidin/lichenicidin family type 2 lantibiotic
MNKRKGHFQMNNIVRAWKDETYRQSLSTEAQAMLPANPAGEIELTDTQLATVYGASDSKEGNDDISDKVDQKAAATYGNKMEFSVVWDCDAKDDAYLTDEIDDRSGKR